MLTNVTRDHHFAKVMQQHIVDILAYLFDKGQTFGIHCKTEDVSFNPELPSELQKNFVHLTLFSLAGYTYESAYIEGEYIIFEAGFGSESFGSVVTVPLLSIVHIIVDETPVFINLCEVRYNELQESTTQEPEQTEIDNSMSVFLSNPENEKFFNN